MSPELSNQIDAWVKSGQATEAAAKTMKARLSQIVDNDPTICVPLNNGIRCEWEFSGIIRIIEVHADGARVYEDERDVED